jgi:riboflavin synthase alpha subunit
MFTGIIEGLGTVVSMTPVQQGQALTIAADFDLTGTKLGDAPPAKGKTDTAG